MKPNAPFRRARQYDEPCCENCSYYYSDGTCRMKERVLESSHTVDELEAMTADEYNEAIATFEDDYCDDYEFRYDDPEDYDPRDGYDPYDDIVE